jgi:hypothetical protein
MGKQTLKLSIGEVEFAEPTIGVFENAVGKSTNPITQVVSFIAACTNKTEADVRSIPLKDYAILKKVADGFLEEAGLV